MLDAMFRAGLLALRARAGNRGRHKLAARLVESNLNHRHKLHASADEHTPQSKIDL